MSVEDYARQHFNAGAEMEHTTTSATLSDLVTKCDFLKIDTDGHDLRVLHGAERMLRNVRPLVILTEADLHGNPRYGDSSLAGIDEFLRGLGYTWLDIDVQRYSRAALPAKFRYGVPATTVTGPIGFCDATYVDDPLAKAGKLSEWLAHGLSRVMKLLALYDVLGFRDCAAELILALSRHPASADKADWPELLRVLDPNYDNLIAQFRADHTTFF